MPPLLAALGMGGRGEAPPTPRAASAVSVTTALATPGSALTVASAFARIASIARALAGSTTMARKTLPSRTVSPEIAPNSGSGVRPSGPGTAESAAMISSRDAILSLHLVGPVRLKRPSRRL